MLLLLALGIIEIGRYLSYSVVIGNAARAGAQTAAISYAEAQATPDPTQTNSTVVTSRAAQQACNDAWHDLSVGNSGFACTSSLPAPKNALAVTTQLNCYKSDGSSVLCSKTPVPVGRTMFLTVTATGTFTSLIKYPLVPNNVPVTSHSTMQVGQ